MKYILDKTIYYINIPKNKRTVNSLEIFNRYFHQSCNGKGLVIIYELTNSIKDKLREAEIKIINDEKKLSSVRKNKFSISRNKSINNDQIFKENTNDIKDYIDYTIKGLNISDNEDDKLSKVNDNEINEKLFHKDFTYKLYNDKKFV